MTTVEQLAEQQGLLIGVLEDAVRDLLAEMAGWANLSPEDAAAAARELMPELVEVFGDEAALLAADFYDEVRSNLATTAAVAYGAQLAPQVGNDTVQDELRWVLAPLFAPSEDDENLAAAYADALSKMGNVLQLLVGDQYRDTIAVSAADDPITGIKYARHGSATACAFCRVMATAGARYLTEESAVHVVGEVDPADLARRIRGPRGPRGEGEKYHDNCRCIAVAVFPGDTLEEAPYVDQWRADYEAAAAAAGGTTRADLKAILAHMRENTGAR